MRWRAAAVTSPCQIATRRPSQLAYCSRRGSRLFSSALSGAT